MRVRPFLTPFKHSRTFSTRSKLCSDTRASDKLFQDAAREEAKGEAVRQKSAHLSFLENREENWTGEESMQDAVLRMLVDKYKPLRSGAIRTAEEKMKGTPPRVGHVGLSSAPIQPSQTGSWANEPLLPSSESHRPWHTEFKVPSHVVSSVKLANIPPLPPRSQSTPQDEKARRQERETLKRTEQAGRLGRARESTLDYKLGLKSSVAGGRPNPVSLKGWAGLIEDRIERARSAGLFNNVKGRGRPLARAVEESNPFIAREEFLMNRIVQKNGAAPPWVELQAELDTAVTTFREVLRQSWTKRAIRNLTTDHPPQILAKFTIEDIKLHRDKTWEQRQMSYHDTAVEEVNSLVRKYNGIAPYAVRRAYYSRSVEVERLYEECAEDILRGIRERSPSIGNTRVIPRSGNSAPEGIEGLDGGFMSIKDAILGLFDRIAGRWKAR